MREEDENRFLGKVTLGDRKVVGLNPCKIKFCVKVHS